MSELHLSMDFACCECDESVGIKVICQGKGLQQGIRTVVAAAAVCCPFCTQLNQVCFHPSGEVVAVRPMRRIGRIPPPSIN